MEFQFFNALSVSVLGLLIWLFALCKNNFKLLGISLFLMLAGTILTIVVLYYHFVDIGYYFLVGIFIWAVMLYSVIYGFFCILKKKGIHEN